MKRKSHKSKGRNKTYRGFYMDARRYEIPLPVLKNSSGVNAAIIRYLTFPPPPAIRAVFFLHMRSEPVDVRFEPVLSFFFFTFSSRLD